MDDQDELAATTAAAEAPPADLRQPWFRRGERLVLGAVAAAIVLVAGVLVVVAAGNGDGDRDGDEVVSGPGDGTTTTDAPAPSTIVPPSTTATTMAATPPPTKRGTTTNAPPSTIAPAREAATLATGDGWQVVREERDEGACIVLLTGDDERRHCGLMHGPVPGPVWTAPLPRGGTLRVVAAGPATLVEEYASSGYFLDDQPALLPDPFRDGAFAVTDQDGFVLLRRGDGILAGLYGSDVVTGEVFGDYPEYRRTSGSLSMGLTQEIGAYRTGGRTCVLARQLAPDPVLLADHCIAGRPTKVSAALVPTTDPALLDLFAIGPPSTADWWECKFPSGELCGSGSVVNVPALAAATISGAGPITVEDNGRRAERVTLIIGDQRVEVPIPAASA